MGHYFWSNKLTIDSQRFAEKQFLQKSRQIAEA